MSPTCFGNFVRYFVYILLCWDNTFYTGWTTDLIKRLGVHNSGKGAKYTRCRRPVTIVYAEECKSKSAAMKEEYRIKQLTREQKEKLCHLNLNQFGTLRKS